MAAAIWLLLSCSIIASGQSSDQNFPSHITSNEITGVIKPRNIGDARLTTYFYLFEGSQGDIFINVATTNFTGDIDVYAADSMKPLTKMVMYADAGRSETGRLIYLRQSTRLLLRIEGRTPNDDTATFTIKFAGSFVALAPETYEPPPSVKRSSESSESRKSSESAKIEETTGGNASANERASTDESKTEDPKPKAEDTVYENKSARVTVKATAKPTTTRRKTTTAPKGGNPTGRAGASSEKPTATQKPKAKTQKPKAEPPPEPDPLANVNLVVVFKDGTVLTRPMIEISRFSFDNGRLTVVEKNGTIARYQMAAIAKVTIE